MFPDAINDHPDDIDRELASGLCDDCGEYSRDIEYFEGRRLCEHCRSTPTLTTLKQLAAFQGCRVRGLADRDDGYIAILLVWETESSQHYFTTGYFRTLRRAVEYTKSVFETENIEMNIYKTKLFPNIRGVMLQEKRITLHMSGKIQIVEMRDGNDARGEIWFTDHEKSAILNRTQLMVIAEVYGPETDHWKGRPIVLYGEFGNWFGKQTWGVRVDRDQTIRASKAKPAAGSKTKKNGQPEPVETIDEIPWDENEDVQLAGVIWSDDGETEEETTTVF